MGKNCGEEQQLVSKIMIGNSIGNGLMVDHQRRRKVCDQACPEVASAMIMARMPRTTIAILTNELFMAGFFIKGIHQQLMEP